MQSYDSSNTCLWLHASSVGEFDQALAILREVKKRDPSRKIALSYFSNSAARTEHPRADFVFALPLDLPFVWSWWLNRINPDSFVTMTWDVFPNLLRSLNKKGVPSYLACAALSSDSRRMRSPYKQLLRPIYSLFTGIGAVDEKQREHFSLLTRHPERVRVTGDSRYDTIIYKINNVTLDPEDQKKIKSLKKRIWILGSTYRSCDEQILPGLAELLEEHPDWVILAFPHHTDKERLIELENSCIASGLKSIRWSRWQPIGGDLPETQGEEKPPQIVLVDRMGILALAYRYGEFAYVGGAFHHRIHNTGEPAALGLPVLTGPFIDTSPVALLLEKGGFLHRFDRGSDLLEKAGEWMSKEKPDGPSQAGRCQSYQEGVGIGTAIS